MMYDVGCVMCYVGCAVLGLSSKTITHLPPTPVITTGVVHDTAPSSDTSTVVGWVSGWVGLVVAERLGPIDICLFNCIMIIL